jgi:hypothetical protein
VDFDHFSYDEKESSFAKTKISGQAQLFYFLQRSQKLLLVMVVVRKFDNIFLVLAYQPGGQHQEVGTNGIERGSEILRRQTKSFEPMNDVGGKEQDLKESNVGRPCLCGDLAQRIVVEEFSDVFLYRGSWLVEEIDAPSADFEVGDKDLVDILFVLEQSELLGFCRILWSGTADDHEAMQFAPLVVDFFPELSHLPAVFEPLEFAASSPLLEVRKLLGDHHIRTSRAVEEPYHTAAVETGVHPQADAASGDLRGYFGQADFEKGDRSARSDGIARSQSAMPELLEMGLETEQRMVGTPAAFLGVVANSCPLGSAIDNNNNRIQIEDQSGACLGKGKQVSPQAVVQPGQLADGFGRQALQEPAQGRLIGELVQSQHFQKGPVVLQNIGLVDAAEPHDDGEDKGHNEFGGMVIGAFLESGNVPLEQVAKSKLVAKTLNQPHPTEVSNVSFLEGKTDFSGTFWHVTQSTPLGAFLSQNFCSGNYGSLYS